MLASYAAASILVSSGRMKDIALRRDILRSAIEMATAADMPEIAERWLASLKEIESSSQHLAPWEALVQRSYGNWSKVDQTVDRILNRGRNEPVETAIKIEALSKLKGPAAAFEYHQALPPALKRSPAVLLAYTNAPNYRYWRRSISGVPYGEVDPVGSFPFRLTATDKVATAGSCFAQHLARRLSSGGFTYLVTEPGHPLLGAETNKEYNYGVFSARYGNIYTSRQLLQLFQRAFGMLHPIDDVWTSSGRYIDPYRPNIQPNGFSSLAEYKRDREYHFAATRRMFAELDVFIFTLGLTEGFVNNRDGVAYPVCPGVAGGTFDQNEHGFVNETVGDIVANFDVFLDELRKINPRSRIILTVSPVPLIATALDRHVLQSTTYSKSVLRVAAQEIADKHQATAYYPSYEIITGNFSRGAYFSEDLRDITEEGVEHVMRLFFRHATDAPARSAPPLRPSKDSDFFTQREKAVAVVCDEELLDSAK